MSKSNAVGMTDIVAKGFNLEKWMEIFSNAVGMIDKRWG
jgi:hypothetical protein